MPLTVVRSDANARLWDACRTSFLDRLGDEPGRTRHPAHLWLGHRTQRDLLLDAAESRGLRGWLEPPFSFLSELPARFALRGRPLRPLTGRMLLARVAARTARSVSFEVGDGPGRSRLIDRALSELLPEGVTPDELEAALERLPADDFTRGRNRWLAETYRAYLGAVEKHGRFDPRSVHALVSERVRGGGLRDAIAGANELHVYGPTSLRGRHRLFEALAEQREVDVRVYLPLGDDVGEWSELADGFDDVTADGREPEVAVQPAPDAIREADWVARTVKSLLVEEGTEPHRIAVVARSGREDTRRLYEALRRAGVPGSVRARTRLADVPALRAILHLFEALGRGWTGASLRPVLKSPYFDVEIDLRPLDVLESRTRPVGLPAWVEGLERLAGEARSERGWILHRSRVTAAGIERDLPVLGRLAREVAPLETPRPEAAWIAATRELLRGRPLGMRERVSEPAGDRWDLVRLDQRGTLALEGLLGEWAEILPGGGEELEPGAWHDRLSRILRSNEIALSTPLQRGVQILEAHEAALTPFEHAFIIHANDGAFPRPAAGSLFEDEETVSLAASGLPFAPRDVRLERENRLWRACTGSARVTVTYWTADANGVPRLPSLFVPAHDRRVELPRTRRRPVDDGRPPLTREELLEREVIRFARERRGGRTGRLETPIPHALRHAGLAAYADELRSGGLDPFAGTAPVENIDPAALFGNDRPLSERPHPWNGDIRDPAVLAHLSERFAPEREWSASWLEQYGRRPFDFLLERVLGLRENRPAEDEASTLTIGGLIHAVLEGFYREAEAATGAGGLDAEREAIFERVFEEACRRYEEAEDRWVGARHVWAATRDELRARLRTFLEWELDQRDAGHPLAVEVSFGRGSELGAADLSGRARDGVDRTLLLRGRIDRLDRIGGNGSPRIRVVDYKSGTSAPGPRAFEDAAALQGALYLAAVESLELGEGALAVYRTVRAPANRARRSAADVESALELARLIPERVRRGLFEAVQARSTEIRDWQPGTDVARTAARISSGTRFDPVSPQALPGSFADGSGGSGEA